MAESNLYLSLLVMLLTATSIGGQDATQCPNKCQCNDDVTVIHCENMALDHVPTFPMTSRKVYLDNNELVGIHNKSFVGLKNIQLLSITNNKITSLKKDDFLGLEGLRILRLAGNKMESLPEDVFQRVQNIVELDLSRNSLTLIPDHALKHCAQLSTLNMSGNYITSAVFGPGFHNTPSLSVVDLSNNDVGTLQAHSFRPVSRFSKSLSMNLSNCKIHHLEEGIFNDMRVLESLDFSGNPAIPKEQLKKALKELEVSTLNVLKLSNMNISDVWTIFHELSLTRLLHLDLSHNRIRMVRKRAFYRLKKVSTLDLSHNLLTTVGDYSGLSRLLNLHLSFNSIRDIDYTKFEVLDMIKALHLDHNRLQNIDDAPFENMFEIEKLDLSFNEISQFDITSAFELLKVLRISSNMLQSLGAISHLRSLEELDMSHNKLTRLDKELFVRGRMLSLVNFSGNAIREIEADTFKLYTPQVIDLSHNKITNVDDLRWTIARKIHLQGNYIQTVSSKSFAGLQWLTYLDLSNNTISTIEDASFRDLRQLETLDLSSNDLNGNLNEGNNARELFNNKTLHLKNLNLANNKITNLDSGIFANVSSIVKLDLSSNRLVSLSESWLSNTASVQVLNVSSNSIATVKPDVLDTLQSLRKLDLSGNPFTCNCDLADFRNWAETTTVELLHFNSDGYYICDGPYSWKGIDLLHFQTHNNCRDPVDKRIILVVIGCTAFAIFLIAGIIFYQHRWRIKRKLARSQDYRAIYHDNNGSGAMTATMSMPPVAPSRHPVGRDWL